ncbi:MAG: NAD(P)H-hydrate dehydratase [Betaproteobacteria bacterium]|nr:NAD(P)H-hydrate dehydratase [Betaproteobacteria bacterium]
MPSRLDSAALRSALPLWDEAALRAAETQAAAQLPPHTLMDRAGAAAARLLRARWPHARSVLLLCGPGNNGGDGLSAAVWLARQPHAPRVHALLVGCGGPERWQEPRRPADWRWALERARAAGLPLQPWAGADPEALLRDSEVVVDALLGLGLREAPRGEIEQAIRMLDTQDAGRPVLALDLPSGLRGALGSAPGACVRATATLAMLGLQAAHATGPHSGLCGELWIDPLQSDPARAGALPIAWLGGTDAALSALAPLERAAHKGERGDLRLFGGAPGMSGALWLAARAALQLGGGRVFAASLDPRAPGLDPEFPELMLRSPAELLAQARAARGPGCVVFGPGAGSSDEALRCLRELLELEQPLVIDADGLNLLAAQPRDGETWRALRARGAAAQATWLTPHPSEAARLLGGSTAEVQSDRLGAARRLAGQTQASIVLKGAGSVVLPAGDTPWINPSGNGLLASAGTGDVLAGALAACLARSGASPQAARAAVWLHGAGADLALHEARAGNAGPALRANTLPAWMLRAWRAACPR